MTVKKIDPDILQDPSWIEFYREHPVLAAEDLLIRNGTNLRLPPHQRIVLKDLWSGRQFPMIIMTRGGGKSTLIAVYFVLRSVLYPNERMGIVSSGFRAAKVCFDEIVRFYNESPILQACSRKSPSLGNDERVWDVTGNGSIIKALPIGDGSKLRGQRFYKLFIDEFPQVDRGVIDEVLIPMLATRKDPTTQKQEDEKGNQLILASTATWQFSWAYKEYLKYKEKVAEGDERYSVHEFDSDDLADFMDQSMVQYSREHSPRVIFLMEYKLHWPKDSDGWFPASLIERTRSSACLIERKGNPNEEYVLGIDPARESDNFAMVVMRLSPNGNRVVNVIALHKPTFSQAVREIRRVLREYNIVRIAMDYGGGGLAVRDGLAEESVYFDGQKQIEEEPILPIDRKQFPDRVGRRILDVVYFSPKEIHQMNMDLKADMENGRVLFPKEPRMDDPASEEIYEQILKLESELRSIEVSTSPTGVLRFDTPNKRMIKDRYTALLLANKAARDYMAEKDTDVKHEELATGFWI